MVDEQDYVWWPLPDGLDAALKSMGLSITNVVWSCSHSVDDRHKASPLFSL